MQEPNFDGSRVAIAPREECTSPRSRIPVRKNSETPAIPRLSTILEAGRTGSRLHVTHPVFSSPLNSIIITATRPERACCIAARRAQRPVKKAQSTKPVGRKQHSRHQLTISTGHSTRPSTSAKRTKMSYEISQAHVASPCTKNSLTHQLTCGHLVLTMKPTNECAGNCLDASAGPMRSLYSIPGNPRNLDTAFICPKDCPLDPAVYPLTKRVSLSLCQLVPESAHEEVEAPRMPRSVSLSVAKPGPEYIFDKSCVLAGHGEKRDSLATSLDAHGDEDEKKSEHETMPPPSHPPRTPTRRHNSSDSIDSSTSASSMSPTSATPSMMSRQRLSLRMKSVGSQRDSAISGLGSPSESPASSGMPPLTTRSSWRSSVASQKSLKDLSLPRSTSVTGQTALKGLSLVRASANINEYECQP